MTQLEAKEIVKDAARCTEATLKAFGIDGCPEYGSGCLSFLTLADYKIRRVNVPSNFTMRQMFKFLQQTERKDYLILTRGHAMAYKDGILIDTMNLGWDSRRIEFLWEVRR